MIFTWIYLTLLIIGTFIGFIRFKSLNQSSKIFAILLLITTITEIIAQVIFRYIFHEANFFIYHIFTPIQFTLIALGYFQEIRLKFIPYLIPIMLIVAITLSLTIQNIEVFNSYFTNLSFFITAIFTNLYFYKLLQFDTNHKFSDFPLFWISCGLLLFTVTNIFVFGTFNTFFNSNNIISSMFRYVRIFTNYILYIMFVIAFLNKQSFIEQNGTRK